MKERIKGWMKERRSGRSNYSMNGQKTDTQKKKGKIERKKERRKKYKQFNKRKKKKE